MSEVSSLLKSIDVSIVCWLFVCGVFFSRRWFGCGLGMLVLDLFSDGGRVEEWYMYYLFMAYCMHLKF